MLHFDDFIQYQNKIRKFNIKDTSSFTQKYEKLQQCLLNSQNNNFITAATFFDILSIAISKMNTHLNTDLLEKIKPAMNYLQLNSNSAVSVKYLASLCFLSESRFFTLFKKQTGMSPIQYKNHLKLNKIAQY